MKILFLPLWIVGVLMGTGCADGNYRPYSVDDNLFKSASQVAKASIANPQAAANPQPNDPRIMDGYAGVSIMSGYRKGFSKITQSGNVNINIGGASK